MEATHRNRWFEKTHLPDPNIWKKREMGKTIFQWEVLCQNDKYIAHESANHVLKGYVQASCPMHLFCSAVHEAPFLSRGKWELWRKTYKDRQYRIEEISKRKTYFAQSYHPEKYDKWCRVVYKLDALDDGTRLICECGNFEHTCLLCCHAVKVLDFLGVDKKTAKHIVKRWTKDARDVLPSIWHIFRRTTLM